METILLSKTKIRFELGKAEKPVGEMLKHIGIHYQTWAQRKPENTWPLDKAIAMAQWIGCRVADLQSDLSLVEVPLVNQKRKSNRGEA